MTKETELIGRDSRNEVAESPASLFARYKALQHKTDRLERIVLEIMLGWPEGFALPGSLISLRNELLRERAMWKRK